MKTYTDQLTALLQKIPASIAEEDLPQLEEAATEFQQLLKQVHHQEGYTLNTQYYYGRIKHIEDALFDAKYGRDQKRRDSSFRKAKQELASGIEALLQLIRDTTEPSDSDK
jgi:predicted component of type VI protein secretion system